MKLLLENWRKFLKEHVSPIDVSDNSEEESEYVPLANDPIVRHNLHMLDTLGGPPATDRFSFPTQEEDMMSLVGSIPPLRT